MDQTKSVQAYLASVERTPLFLQGDVVALLATFPSACIDCALTSPPYWGQRAYVSGGIGLEGTWQEYVNNLLTLFKELQRVLKPTGSFWLNIGDSYQQKTLLGLPWRVALAMTDTRDGYCGIASFGTRSRVDQTMPKTSSATSMNMCSTSSHLTVTTYDVDAIRSKPGQARVVNGAIISATGVSGVRYRRQIELSTALNASEKAALFGRSTLSLKKCALGSSPISG